MNAGQAENVYQLIHDQLSLLHSVDNYQNAINARNRKQELPEILLAPGEKRSILLQAFAKHSASTTPKLSAQTVKSLHILSGTKQHPAESLLTKIGPTISVSGEIMLAKLLVLPVVDIDVLDHRQRAIQFLINHPDVLHRLEELLLLYATDEDGLIALFDPYDTVNSPSYDDIDRRTRIPWLNGSGSQEEVARRLNDTINISTALNVPLALLGSTFLGNFSSQNGVMNGLVNSTANLPANLVQALADLKIKYSDLSSPIKIFSTGSFVALQVIALYKSYYRFREHLRAYRFIVERSRRPGRALASALEMEKILDAYPQLQAALSPGKGLLKLHNTTSMVEIMSLLKDTPESPPGFIDYVASDMGRYKRSLTLLKRNHLSLARVMEVVGELDAWVTTAIHFRSSREWVNNRLVFPQYLRPPGKPQLVIEKLWNPLIPSFSAVANSFSSGGNIPASTVITAPNAAGKSTITKGTALNIILAQTLALAAAEHMVLTPFSFIYTHTFDEPEVISGVSSFSAESRRVIELFRQLKALSMYQYSAIFIDELFSNTRPAEGEMAALAVVKTLAMHPDSLNVTATHYQKLTSLASQYPDRFQNFHFSAALHQDGSLRYDYLMSPGASQQNVAFDILREEGIGDDFLDIIQGTEKYPE